MKIIFRVFFLLVVLFAFDAWADDDYAVDVPEAAEEEVSPFERSPFERRPSGGVAESHDEVPAENESLSAKDEWLQKKHQIVGGRAFVTFTDIVSIFAAFFDVDRDEDDDIIADGAYYVGYGYKLGPVLETGLVFNFARVTNDMNAYTIMPRLKWNLWCGKYFKAFSELDVGVMFLGGEYGLMFQTTLLGVEIGNDIAVQLYIPGLAFGQQGAFNVALAYRF